MTPRSLRLTTVALVSLLLSVSAASVAAQEAEEDPVAAAAKLYKEGVESYFAADYAVAITKFRDGYALDPNAMFLYNLSLCFSKLSNFPAALEHAQKAEELGGMPDEATTKNRGRLSAFTVLVSAETLAPQLAAPPEPEPEGCRVDTDCASGQVCDIALNACVPGPPPEPEVEPMFGTAGWIGIGVGAVGVSATVVAVAISAGLNGDLERYDQLVANKDPGAAPLRDSITRRQRTGRIMLFTGIGGIAVGVGLVAYDLFFADRAAGGSALVPVLSPDGAGVVWRAHF